MIIPQVSGYNADTILNRSQKSRYAKSNSNGLPKLFGWKSTSTTATHPTIITPKISPPVQITPTRILSYLPRETDRNRSPPLGRRFNSIIKGYRDSYNDVKTRYLIMTTVSGIDHPGIPN